MLTKKILLSSVAILALSLSLNAEELEETQVEEEESTLEISGYLKAEASVFTKKGTSKNAVGQGSTSATQHDAGDFMKTEGTLKVFVNGEMGEESSFHAELQAISDREEIAGYKGHRNYTQNDFIRELYIDTSAGGWDFRLGKQQVVWGKADGVKFLDIINPTDFREWGQNTMEDSRIPLWMLTAEKDLGNNDSLQLVWVPDVGRINQIPGLNDTSTGDQGQSFVSLGAESITGQYNGFLNIGNDMGQVAGAFYQKFGGNFSTTSGNLGLTINSTVHQYTDGLALIGTGAKLDGVISSVGSTTNLSAGNGNYDYDNPSHMFEYMGDTTFATFDAFAGMSTEYRINHLSQKLKNHNFGIRYKKSTDFGLNYTLNYYRHWENNPMVNMHWEGAAGQTLNAITEVGAGQTTVRLFDSTTNANYNQTTQGRANLIFEQDVNRVNTFGASFDYAIDTDFAPIVIRGEFVYDKGSKVPEVDLGKLAYGDLVGAMSMADADLIKYVIGADVTVAKNLFVSLQFMDTWNLDHVDTLGTSFTGSTQNYGKFTANPATLSLTNGFKKAEEHQIMYTLFLSKPFLESDAMRVNNLFLYEQEGGGFWNRLDLEYSYADDIILSAEWNVYGGDEYGVFGQFKDQSNAQVGVKYLF